MRSHTPAVFRNWAGNHTCCPVEIHEPRTEEGVHLILERAQREGAAVKVVGAGHSWSDAACTDGRLIRLDRLSRLISVDRSGGRVTVEAGIRLRTLSRELATEGMALPVLGSIGEQSVAGAISTGTHGSGGKFGNLSSLVEAVRLVTATGQTLDVDSSGGELLSAARLGLGSLGVITRVTLRCEPAFALRENTYSLAFDDSVARMQSIVDAHEHVKFWWLPHTRRVQVFEADRVRNASGRCLAPQELGIGKDGVRWTDGLDGAVNRGVFPLLLRLGARLPAAVPSLNHLVGAVYLRPHERVDVSTRVFHVPMPPVHHEAEFGIPRERAGEALSRLRRMIDELALRVGFVVEVRFVARDDILLSSAYGRDSCQIGAYIGAGPDHARYFAGFEELCGELGGRPHWGKEFRAGRDRLREACPGHGRFEVIRRELDPRGLFENSFVRRVFGERATG